MNVKEFEKKLLNKINALPSIIQLVLVVALIAMFVQLLTLTAGEKIENLTKVNGVLESVECTSRISGSDNVYLKTSLSNTKIRFIGYKKCTDLKLFKDNKIAYDVTFYIKPLTSANSQGPVDGIFAVDYNGREFIHPSNGLAEHEIFNFYSLIFLYLAFFIGKNLYSCRYMAE